MREDFIIQRIKRPSQVMAGRVISIFRTGRLYIVIPQQYRFILEQCLIPQLCDWAEKKGLQGQETCFYAWWCPCHKGCEVTRVHEDHHFEASQSTSRTWIQLRTYGERWSERSLNAANDWKTYTIPVWLDIARNMFALCLNKWNPWKYKAIHSQKY